MVELSSPSLDLKNKIKEGFDSYVEGCYRHNEEHTNHHIIKSQILDQVCPKLEGLVLDVGTGNGSVAKEIYNRSTASRIHGIDFSSEMIKAAVENHKENPNLSFEVGDLENMSHENSKFDMITCGMTLPWLVDKEKALSEMIRVCKPNGKLLFLEEFWKSEPRSIVPHNPHSEHRFKLLDLSTYLHIDKFKGLMSSNGCSLEKEVAMDVDEHHYMAGLLFTKLERNL